MSPLLPYSLTPLLPYSLTPFLPFSFPPPPMPSHAKPRPLFDPPILKRAVIESFKKLDPRHQVRNPVMFTVFVGSLLTTGLGVQALVGQGEAPAGFIFGISLWLWFTVLF